MVASNAVTPQEYLNELPSERRELVGVIRQAILDNLPDGYQEAMSFGMLSYVVPLEVFADTYNGQPLSVIALANQKHHVAVYLMGVYADDGERRWFVDAWAATGKPLDMGKSCIRFKRLDDVAFDVLAQAVARVPPERLIAAQQAAHAGR